MQFTLLDETKVFRDPIYTYIKVDYKVIWDLINTKEFQRLRRIKQLGGVSMVFHNAEHTRFSHALGVYNLARQVIKEVPELKETIGEAGKVATLAAALLHDLGHGPFSHAFEHVLHVDHEEYTCKIIEGDTEVNKALKQVSEDFPLMVSSIIKKDGKYPLLSSIVSNQTDVDRADYLQRDAYFTGANYGTIDIPRIIRTMRLVNNELVFKVSSVHTIEDYLMSRYQMYWQVYFHKNSRAFEVILEKIFQRIKDLVEQNYNFKTDITKLRNIIRKNFTLKDYIRLDDTVVMAIIIDLQDEDDIILRDLTDRFVNRKLFVDAEWTAGKASEEKLQEIQDIFAENGLDPKYYVSIDRMTQYIYKNMNTEMDKIRLISNDGKIHSIEEVSNILSGLTKVKNKVDYRIFFPKEILTLKGGKSLDKLHKLLY